MGNKNQFHITGKSLYKLVPYKILDVKSIKIFAFRFFRMLIKVTVEVYYKITLVFVVLVVTCHLSGHPQQ